MIDEIDDIGYIFLYHTHYGKVQVPIMECVSKKDAQKKADLIMKERGFAIND